MIKTATRTLVAKRSMEDVIADAVELPHVTVGLAPATGDAMRCELFTSDSPASCYRRLLASELPPLLRGRMQLRHPCLPCVVV